MSGGIEQGLHEKLCAYVLGELAGAERAEVERELLRSAELRAEKERLEATIGAVKDALAPAQSLSGDARHALERAVRPAPMARFPWLRLAAGIGAVGLGWWVFARGGGEHLDPQIARLERGVGPETSAERAERDRAEFDKGRARWDSMPAEERAQFVRKFGTLEYSGENTLPQTIETGRVSKLDARPDPMLDATTLGLDVHKGLGAASSPEEAGDTRGMNLAQQQPMASEGKVGGGLTGDGASDAKTVGTMIYGGRRAAPLDAQEVVVGSVVVSAEPAAPAATARAPLQGRPSGPISPGPASPAVAAGTLKSKDAAGAGLPGATTPKRDPEVGSLSYEEDAFFVGLGSLGYVSGDDDEARKSERLARTRAWHTLTPGEQAQHIELRCGTIVRDCRPRPSERPRDMFFRFWGDNPFEVTLLDKLSTFSIDVDTASYALARRYLVEGQVPEKAQVRTEEFVNWFASDVEAPRNATFAVHSDLTPSRFSADAARRMLRVVVRAKDVQKDERDPLRLTFVVDVSGSMKEQQRLETVKHALRMLVAQLDARDSIALVTFSNDGALRLAMTPVTDRAAIEAAIAPLVPDGSTNSNAGLQLGYAQALAGLDREAVNRVVFLSDGVANVGETDAQKITDGVKGIREKGIYLNTIGVGMNNHNDALLEQLADLGDGVCNYVDGPQEIQRALVERFTGAFQPVAKDVKIQVEFDPSQVLRYRLLGYENRAIADADFRNDAVDAGEVGAGHQVTALYEIEPTGVASNAPMATVRVRWKQIRPAGESGVQEATEAAFGVRAASYTAYEAAPIGHRRALIVAQFAEILRRSIHARGDSLDDLIREATNLQAQIPNDAEFAEFTALLVRTKELVLRALPACDEMCQTVDALRSNAYLGAVFQETGRDATALAQVEAERQKLEARLRELLIRQAQAEGALPLQSLGYTGEPR